jgi:hypothetical protein
MSDDDFFGMTNEEFYERCRAEDREEVVGVCDNCGSNIYFDEADSTGWCGMCQWFASQGMPEQRASE